MADGSLATISEKTTLNFYIEPIEQNFVHEFYILENSNVEGILGLDFLTQHNCIINCGFDYIIIKNHKVEFITTDQKRWIDFDKELLEKTKINNFSYVEIYREQLSEKIRKMPTLGKIEMEPIRIPLVDNIPTICKAYPISVALREKVKYDLGRLQELGIITKSRSNYASPAFFALKKDGSIRILIDYRKLNQKLVDTSGTFPTVYDELELLAGKTLFSKINLQMGYYQVPVHANDQHKLAFITPLGHFQFTRLPFGISTAPRIFQRIMRDIFEDIDYVKIYLDDIVISSFSADEHYLHCENVLERLIKYNIVSTPKNAHGLFLKYITGTYLQWKGDTLGFR